MELLPDEFTLREDGTIKLMDAAPAVWNYCYGLSELFPLVVQTQNADNSNTTSIYLQWGTVSFPENVTVLSVGQ